MFVRVRSYACTHQFMSQSNGIHSTSVLMGFLLQVYDNLNVWLCVIGAVSNLVVAGFLRGQVAPIGHLPEPIIRRLIGPCLVADELEADEIHQLPGTVIDSVRQVNGRKVHQREEQLQDDPREDAEHSGE